ncbi:energy-coupling factor transporter ATP-binding protein EcfA2 [Catenulispora sp. GAS73]|uniref:AAA family ATPase n=1 Tax=Catenulispora sp. GAS73 TaxID=3156269 RepID=UPI0035130531
MTDQSADIQTGTAGSAGAVTAKSTGELPLWAVVLGWELRRGRQVILHGEVNDRYWLWGRPASFQAVLAEYLEITGAEVVVWWDPLDGMTFPIPGHHERFAELLLNLGRADVGTSGEHHGDDERALPQENQNPQNPYQQDPDQQDPDTEQPARPGSRRAASERAGRRVLAPRGSRAALPSDINEALDLARRVAASPLAATAFVFQDLDAALPTGDPTSAEGYLRLRAAMDGAVAPLQAAGKEPFRRNAVLAVTGNLARLPDWLNTEDPRIVPLRVNRPDQDERRWWLDQLRSGLHGVDPGTDLEPLVRATDGLAGWELDALVRTSMLRGIPADHPAKLLNELRFNVRTNPWEKLDRGVIANSAQALSAQVIGQQAAVTAVADALNTAYAGVEFGSSGTARPRGVFFFVGPTGVGKTELAKAVTRLLFGDEAAFARFDMSEYREEHAAERLAGAPPGYVGYEQGGELTRRVQERPFSVLLFDEIEKAHPVVLDKFLQIIEDGRLTDGRGQTAYFSQTLVIFTSNTGADAMWDLVRGAADDLPYERIQEHFMREVEAAFQAMHRPEIFGRLKPGVVVFDLLRSQYVTGITNRLLDQLAGSALEDRKIVLDLDRRGLCAWVLARMQLPENARYGGRQIRNELEGLRVALAGYVVEANPAEGSRLRVGVDAHGGFEIFAVPAIGGADPIGTPTTTNSTTNGTAGWNADWNPDGRGV